MTQLCVMYPVRLLQPLAYVGYLKTTPALQEVRKRRTLQRTKTATARRVSRLIWVTKRRKITCQHTYLPETAPTACCDLQTGGSSGCAKVGCALSPPLPAARLSPSDMWSLRGTLVPCQRLVGHPEKFPKRGSCAPAPEGPELLSFAQTSTSLRMSNRAGKGTGLCRYGLRSKGTELGFTDIVASSGDGKRQEVTTSSCGNNSAWEKL